MASAASHRESQGRGQQVHQRPS